MKIDGEIKGEKVYLRSATIEDAEYTYTIRQDGKRTKYMHTLSGGIEEQKRWLINQIKDLDSYFFIACDLEGSSLGTYAIYRINQEAKTGELGRALLLGNPIQNLETIYLVHEFAFFELGLEVLYANAFEENIAAIGVNKQVGGIEVEKKHNEEFDMVNIKFKISKGNYLYKREKIKQLVERFCKRE